MTFRQDIYDTYASVSGLSKPLQSKYDSLLANLHPWLRNASGKVLDIGSGQGELLDVCRALNLDAEGVDVSEELASSCLARGLRVQRIADLPDFLGGCANRYSVVTMIDVLEHFTRPEAVTITNLIRSAALAPSGRLILQVPNMQSLFAAANLYHDLTHEWGYTEASLRQLLLSAGFQRVSFYPQDFPLQGLHIVRRALRAALYAVIRLVLFVDQPNRGTILTPNLIAVAER